MDDQPALNYYSGSGSYSPMKIRIQVDLYLFKLSKDRAEIVPQMAGCLLTCMESCIQFPALNKPGLMAHSYSPSTLNAREVEAERPVGS